MYLVPSWYLHSSSAVAQWAAGWGPWGAVLVIPALTWTPIITCHPIIRCHKLLMPHLWCRPPRRPCSGAGPCHQTAGSRCSSPTCCSTGCTRLVIIIVIIIKLLCQIRLIAREGGVRNNSPTSQSFGVSQVRPWAWVWAKKEIRIQSIG